MAAAEHARAPNVVLITIDTLRADRVGCYGYQQARTATLDNLARDGVAFRTVVVSSPLTFPSHCSILTGTSPPVHGVRDNVGYRFSGRPPTLAQVLRSQHYATGAFVGAYLLDKRRGLGEGFETYASPFRGTLENSLVNNLQSAQRRAEEVIADARNRIASLLAQAGVGVAFNQRNSDFTLSVVPMGTGGDVFGKTPRSWFSGYGLNGFGAPGNSGQVYVNNIASAVNNSNVGFAVGTIATHELTHFLFGSFFPGSNVGTLQQEEAGPAR